MTRVSPLDSCAVHQDVDIMAVVEHPFHQGLDVFSG